MLIFLSGSENNVIFDYMENNNIEMYYHLFSYYYLSQNNKIYNRLLKNKDNFRSILIDSRAHTFHTAKNLDFKKYTENYANWIEEFDDKNVLGYFEMDIDNRIGYDEVLKLRKILDDKSDKIIPVWHKNRGISEFIKLCKDYDFVSISCLPIEGIKFEDFKEFIRIAHKYDSKIHGLGGTRKNILNECAFDAVDSASWLFESVYNRYNGRRVNPEKTDKNNLLILSFLKWRKKQLYYKKLWDNRRK